MTKMPLVTPLQRTKWPGVPYSSCAVLALLFGSLGIATTAQAVVVTGNIYTILDDQQNRIGSTVDHWYFAVNTAGIITIDTLSWEVDSADHDLNGNYDETFDVNGDGEIAFFDPYIYLFHDDGSLDAGDLIAANDDSSDTFADGSIYAYDSYLSVNLGVGNYILAIGAFSLSVDEAISQFNNAIFYPTTVDGFGNLSPIDHGDYQITFTGDVSVVPEPSSIVISCIGLTGVAAYGWRRRRAR